MVFDISLKTTSEDFQFFFFDWAPIVDVAGRSGRIMKFAASYAGICQGICCVQHPVAGRPAGARFFPPFSTPPASRQGIRHRRGHQTTTTALLRRRQFLLMMAAERTHIYKARKTDIFQDNKTSREFL